jgi:hypothetical protein
MRFEISQSKDPKVNQQPKNLAVYRRQEHKARETEIVGIITSRDLMPITCFVVGDDGMESKDLSGIGYIMLARDEMNRPLIINKILIWLRPRRLCIIRE